MSTPELWTRFIDRFSRNLADVREVGRQRRPPDDEIPPLFVCPRCKRESWSPDDRRYGYCGGCQMFTGEPRDD